MPGIFHRAQLIPLEVIKKRSSRLPDHVVIQLRAVAGPDVDADKPVVRIVHELDTKWLHDVGNSLHVIKFSPPRRLIMMHSIIMFILMNMMT